MKYDVVGVKGGAFVNEKELRLHRCCFTGHRPEKLGTPEEILIVGLRHEIERAIGDGFTTFITGMARGVDVWAGEIVIDLRKSGQPIRLICASPYRGFEERWSSKWQERYRAIMEQADLTRYICPGYSAGCFQRRNEWMVDHSSRVIAVYNGQPGGTQNTIHYAQKEKINVEFVGGAYVSSWKE